ncbi:hypothetical protein U1Q18_013353 [Sarracenia purpurea var. burkii]
MSSEKNSNMTSNSESFIVKGDKKQIEIEVSSRPTLEFPEGSQSTVAGDSPELGNNHGDEEQVRDSEDERFEEPAFPEELKTPLLGEFEVDDNDGFKTPTSLEHRIPAATQCPPAPRKLSSRPLTKRKASPRVRRNLQLDLSEEVESTFSPPFQEDLGRKIKRARRESTD